LAAPSPKNVTTTCPECQGRRYRKEILDIKVRSRSIAEVLDLTVREAFRFFRAQPAIEKKLKAAHIDLSATEALTILKSIRIVDIALGNGTIKRTVTTPSQRAATILRAIGIKALDPPTPQTSGQTIM